MMAMDWLSGCLITKGMIVTVSVKAIIKRLDKYWNVFKKLDDDDDDYGLIIRVFDYKGYDSDCEWESNRQDNLHPSAPTEQRPTTLKLSLLHYIAQCILMHNNAHYDTLYSTIRQV